MAGVQIRNSSFLLVKVYIILTSKVSSKRDNQMSLNVQSPIEHIINKNKGCDEMQFNVKP